MFVTTESGDEDQRKGAIIFSTCTACRTEEGVVEYGGETLCSRCASLQEWAVVIAMIQRQLEPARTAKPAAVSGGGVPAVHAPAQVAADPFSAA